MASCKFELTSDSEVKLKNGVVTRITRVGHRQCLPEEIAATLTKLDKHYLGNIDDNVIIWADDGRRVVYLDENEEKYGLAKDDDLNIVEVVTENG